MYVYADAGCDGTNGRASEKGKYSKLCSTIYACMYVNVLMCISFVFAIWIWQERELGDINNKLKVNVFNWTSELYIKSFLITIILCYSNYLVSCRLFINLIK